MILLFPVSSKNKVNDLDLPVVVPDENWQPLRKTVDKNLQRNLRSRLSKRKKWASLLKRKKMAVGLVDLSRPDAVRFAEVNGDHMMYAASLPKIAILMAACQAFDSGALKEKPDIMNDLNDMIRHSDNASATRMIDILGYSYIESVVTNPMYKLYDPVKGGGLWVGKRYARYGRRYPDPVKNLVHAATATQVCRFYYLLATGRLLNPYRSRQMLDILSRPAIIHKFVYSLNGVAKNAQIYRKSGTWRWYHSDSVLVWGADWRRYILVGLVADRRGEQILRDLLPAVEAVLKAQPE